MAVGSQAFDVRHAAACRSPRTEAGRTNIDCVGPMVEGFDTDFGVTRRREEFNLMHAYQ
jgi:hypothetical protein